MLYLLNQLRFWKKKSHLLSCHGLLKSSIFYAIIWKLNFGVNLVTSFSRHQRWNSIFSSHENMKSSKFYNPAKFQLKQIKTVRAVFGRFWPPVSPACYWQSSNFLQCNGKYVSSEVSDKIKKLANKLINLNKIIVSCSITLLLNKRIRTNCHFLSFFYFEFKHLCFFFLNYHQNNLDYSLSSLNNFGRIMQCWVNCKIVIQQLRIEIKPQCFTEKMQIKKKLSKLDYHSNIYIDLRVTTTLKCS